ncbi:diacylglycerol/lipid kinase family protein [Hymenobacter bucti]|uniref:Diacylglycerol/lipid kinase family protein n=1 Tax=Hymenobacter bucti TaxID=1844114 RepID=A0ABW4R0C6_9BACT
MPRTCFIFNPMAGTGRRAEFPALLARYFGSEASGDYLLRPTEGPGHATELARAAAQAGCRVVVAVGGDGTVNEVGQGLLHQENTAMGIVPRGSGNGLARHLKVPLNLGAALRRLRQPAFSRMDVGCINDRPFFCTAGLGFDARVSQQFAQAGSRGLSTYLRVTLQEYKTFEPVPIAVDTNGQTLRTDCYVLAFANASQYGNDVYIAPNASLQDGLLDMCLINALPPWRAVQVAMGMALGTLPRTGGAAYSHTSHATVRAAAPIGYHADGDYLGHATEFVIDLLPLALEVAM